jgi:protein-S-isoprenylcysteine O-methyltransferase Ste14
MPSFEHRIPPPLVAAAVAAAMWAVSPLEPALPLPLGLRGTVTAALAIAGLAFDVLGLWAFVRARTTINPLQPDKSTALVTSGVFRLTRNPMYLGLLLLLSAWAVHLSTLWPLGGPVVFVLYINRFQIVPEERVIAHKFGEAFAAYATRVRRWL